MQISGLQKMTLLDYPGQIACTVFTGGCNLRCPFCHNASLVLPERTKSAMDVSEVLRFLEKRQGMLDGVAVTGGEPLLNADLAEFLRRVRALGYRIKLDTNGTFPERLRALVEEGLVDRVAMDVKNAPLLYGKTVG
ncbi:MAG: anaerobic ribonucleoside-triphosphate reductase activating protein, partial [Clostridia bacterium]|nr:anaerobic ribonucleoside-triphosphate reductase activating protein [Clostridia bacterium]